MSMPFAEVARVSLIEIKLALKKTFPWKIEPPGCIGLSRDYQSSG
jgi:hypothetical protein